jgi:serine/threonine protein phosphatase PrpC
VSAAVAAPADCPACADERAAGASFCEACGNALTTASGTPTPAPVTAGGAACPACGTADAVGADGYCTNCGILAVRPRDHIELTVQGAGAVTDRGRRHHRNEDAVWLAARGTDVDVVVCDGVSSSFDPDTASAVAAQTAGRLLATADTDPGRIGAAIVAAGADVAALARTGDPRRAMSNPACTIVAACLRGAAISFGWVGDSRAYWIPADGPAVQLTEDDSWAAHAIGTGMDPELAWSDRRAHAITGWLGADAGVIEPRTGRFVPDAPGHLLLCSDGLWNYLTDHARFADTVREHLAAGAGLTAAAASLTAFANDAGGSDNITVALAPVAPNADSGDQAQ